MFTLCTILMSGVIPTVFSSDNSPKCLPELFLRETHNYNPNRNENRNRFPAESWKFRMVNSGEGQEIYTALDSKEHVLMLHATGNRIGLEIYRVCEKGFAYPNYGKVVDSTFEGYRVKVKNIFRMDVYLYEQGFNLYSTPRSQINTYYKNKKERNERKFKMDNPKLAHTFEVGWFVCTFICKFIIYIVIPYFMFNGC